MIASVLLARDRSADLKAAVLAGDPVRVQAAAEGVLTLVKPVLAAQADQWVGATAKLGRYVDLAAFKLAWGAGATEMAVGSHADPEPGAASRAATGLSSIADALSTVDLLVVERDRLVKDGSLHCP